MKNTKPFLYCLVPVFIMIGVMIYTGSQAGGDKNIIVKLELAQDIDIAQALLAPYDEVHLQWLRLNTQLDFVFILTYSMLFYFALVFWISKIPAAKDWSQVPLLAFIPGLLDVVENLFILRFLNHDFSTTNFSLYYWCVHIKWGLIPFLLIPTLGLLALLIYKKIKG